MADKINILTPQDWRDIGTFANKLIQNDFGEGKFQNNRSNLQYLSQQYKKYKANNMRRLTKGGELKYFDPSQDYRGRRYYGSKKALKKGKKGFTSGDRINGYYQQPIESTNTAFVDMTLTGRLKKSLIVKENLPNGIRSGYSTSDDNPGKIEGNRKYGREVLGLSDENQDKVKDYMIGLMKNHVKEFNQSISIKVTF